MYRIYTCILHEKNVNIRLQAIKSFATETIRIRPYQRVISVQVSVFSLDATYRGQKRNPGMGIFVYHNDIHGFSRDNARDNAREFATEHLAALNDSIDRG